MYILTYCWLLYCIVLWLLNICISIFHKKRKIPLKWEIINSMYIKIFNPFAISHFSHCHSHLFLWRTHSAYDIWINKFSFIIYSLGKQHSAEFQSKEKSIPQFLWNDNSIIDVYVMYLTSFDWGMMCMVKVNVTWLSVYS